MQAFPPASARSSGRLALLTPLAVAIGVVVLLLLPNLLMHADPGSPLPAYGHAAASQSAAAAMASPMVR